MAGQLGTIPLSYKHVITAELTHSVYLTNSPSRMNARAPQPATEAPSDTEQQSNLPKSFVFPDQLSPDFLAWAVKACQIKGTFMPVRVDSPTCEMVWLSQLPDQNPFLILSSPRRSPTGEHYSPTTQRYNPATGEKIQATSVAETQAEVAAGTTEILKA
jgi:hypothetical protein